MKSFVTGSRAYGTPRKDSDIDLVIFADNETAQLLAEQAANREQALGSGAPDDVSLRFGRLNLIVLTDEDKFDLWQKATQALIARRPVTREEAVDYHREHVDAALAMSRQADADFCNPNL